MSLTLLPLPPLRGIHLRLIEWLPGDGSWAQEPGIGTGAGGQTAMLAALEDLRTVNGMAEMRQGRCTQPRSGHRARMVTQWRATAEGVAYKARRP